ncbi:MAG: hypothetical protein BMS9Abin37_1226 [Acidobacteriota bacterium]|nr:MAG: hypothetical protein BMS9Abin37_1226 [Acidobacteriota bacterium]
MAMYLVTRVEAGRLHEQRRRIHGFEDQLFTSAEFHGAYGQTEAGRYLTVIFIRKLGGRALIITARDMDSKERKQYGR